MTAVIHVKSGVHYFCILTESTKKTGGLGTIIIRVRGKVEELSQKAKALATAKGIDRVVNIDKVPVE